MDTRYLRTLIVTVESGSFSQAAKNLNITQSAVSQRIKFLEDQYGHLLLDRSGPTLVVTPAGQVVLAKAREILRKERELADCLKGLGSQQRLALCCTPTFGMAFLPEVLNSFIRLHTEIADLKFVFMQPTEAVHELRNERFDLAAIEHCPGLDFSGLDRYVLPEDELFFVTAPGNLPAVNDGCVSLGEITHFRLFARRDGCSSKEILRQVLRARGGDLSNFENVVISDDLRFTIQAVIAGEGIAFLSKTLVIEHLAQGELIGFTLCGVPQRRGRCVLVPPGRQQDPLLSDLLECIFRVVSPDERPHLISGTKAI